MQDTEFQNLLGENVESMKFHVTTMVHFDKFFFLNKRSMWNQVLDVTMEQNCFRDVCKDFFIAFEKRTFFSFSFQLFFDFWFSPRTAEPYLLLTIVESTNRMAKVIPTASHIVLLLSSSEELWQQKLTFIIYIEH